MNESEGREAHSVDDALSDPESVRSLRLWNDRALTALPDGLAACRRLRKLAIGSSPVTRLPDWLGRLPELEELEIGLAEIDEIPSLGGCGRLRSLKLVFCEKMTALPAGLEALAELELAYTPIARFPGELRQLRQLTLHRFGLKQLPEELRRFAHLALLDLKNNELQEIPSWIAELSQLRVLRLHGNPLAAIAPAVFALPRLEELDLDRCGGALTALPETLGELRSLRILRLTGHKLAALPDSIGDLAKLEILAVAENRLAALPESIGRLSALRQLDLRRNLLPTLPPTIGALESLAELDVTDCPLRELPQELGMLQRLTTLKIGSTLDPRSAAYAEGYGRGGDLTLPPLGRLSQLRVLNASNAGLHALPADLGGLASLELVFLDQNRLTRLPEEFFTLPKVRVVSLLENVFAPAAHARLVAWAAARGLSAYYGGSVRLPHVAPENQPPPEHVSAEPLAAAVLAQIARLGGVVDRKTSAVHPPPETLLIRETTFLVPEAIRQFVHDVTWPAGLLTGTIKGWDLHVELRRRGDLSEYPCTFGHPLISIGTHARQNHLALDLSDPQPTDPTVWYIDHESTQPDALSFGPLSAFLAALCAGDDAGAEAATAPTDPDEAMGAAREAQAAAWGR